MGILLHRIKFLSLTVVLLLVGGAHAQDIAGESNKRVENFLISVPVVVNDKNDRSIPDLTKGDFSLLDDGKVREIDFFAVSGEPVNIALLLDTSPSTSDVFVDIKRAALGLIQNLNAGDKLKVTAFGKDIAEKTPLTSNRLVLERAIRSSDSGLDVGSVMRDAVSKTLRGEFGKIKGRKAIIVMTDGVDFGSRISKDELMLDIEESDTLIYTIYYRTEFGGYGRGPRSSRNSMPNNVNSRNQSQSPGTRRTLNRSGRNGDPRKYLNRISDATAGSFHFLNADQIRDTLSSIVSEMRTHYRLGFYLPTNSGATGDSHSIKVTVSLKKSVVRARQSYRVK
jgi:VWFA-related protein